MEKLLMLGSILATEELIGYAKRQGIYTIVTDYLEPEESPAKLLADEYWMLSTADIDEMAKKCREEGITAVLTGVSEFNLDRLAELCRALDLPCYTTPESRAATKNKSNFKKLCHETGVPVATDYYLSNPPTEEQLDEIRFPVVVKAIDLCANRGMSYCYNKEEVVQACAYARSMSKNDTIITERMLRGHEYAAFYALAEGQASLYGFAAMLSQPGYPSNCYSVTTTATNNLSRYLKEMDPQYQEFLRRAGCQEGLAWVEMMQDVDTHLYALEMGFRLSGDLMAYPFHKATGFDSFQWLLDTAMGVKHTKEQLPAPLTQQPQRFACSYILWSITAGTVGKMEGVEEIEKLPNVRVEYNTRQGDTFRDNQYMLTFTFDTGSNEEMIDMIRRINETVIIEDENGNNAVIYYDDFDTMRKLYEEGKQGL